MQTEERRSIVGIECMGLGPPEIELYRQIKLQGALEGISEVMELGSQDFWCPQKNLVIALGKAFGRDKVDPVLLNTTNASQQPARLLCEALGIKYGCVDVDGRVGSVVMDLNFDDVPAAAHPAALSYGYPRQNRQPISFPGGPVLLVRR
jgi:hypothetical protein